MRLFVLATVFLAAAALVRAQDAASTPFQQRSPATTDESPTPTATVRPTESTTPKPSPRPTVKPLETSTPDVIETQTPKPAATATSTAKPTATATSAAKPTATATAKPIATATATATAKPTATATATTKPTATATATLPPKPTPSPTPKPSPSVDVSPAAGDDSVASKLKELESRWEGSLLNHNTSAIEKMVAEDFIGTSSSGKQGDKATLLAEAKRDTNVYSSAVSSEMNVRTFAPNVAVVTGVAKETGKTKAGKAFSHTYRFTDTWVERNGQWQCVAAQAMALPKK
jgi:ketosteroid isomerase-like protein